MNIALLRHEFNNEELTRESLAENPFEQFATWFKEALEIEAEPNALSLGTADKDGSVSVRTVLLKEYDERGFCIFTNYNSRKGLQLAENKRASMLFPWLKMERQIEICGVVERVSREESEAYFRKRPRGSQIGAWVSPQSTIIPNRDTIEEKMSDTESLFMDEEIPLPKYWGGFRLVPESIEFWQGRPNRLHDRFRYSVTKNGLWEIDRLAP